MYVKLIGYTPDPVSAVANAATLCHAMDARYPDKTIALLLRRGHMTPFEHAVFRFEISDISRSLSHQLVRHRMASITQESQRIVEPKEHEAIFPPSVMNAGKDAIQAYETAISQAFRAVKHLLQLGVPLEDARYLLPNAAATHVLLTMNARSLINFFEQRCCMMAQWEIRELADQMLGLVQDVAPEIFAKAGRTCKTRGICREGRPCSKAPSGVFIPK